MQRVRAGMLRQAIFTALGLLPVACGGTSTSSPSAGGASSTGGTTANSSGSSAMPSGGAGSGSVAGSAGSPVGGEASAGKGGAGGDSGGAGGKPSSGGAGGKPSGVAPFPCEGSVPVGGDHPGYSRCGESGVWHRPAVVECPPSATGAPGEDGIGCLKDSDCGGGEICVCGQPSQCASATCVTDADCGTGFVCRGYSTSPCDGPGVVLPNGFACQTTDDVCATFQQCKDGMRCGGDSGTFVCDVNPVNPGCGRPFLVSGAERVAPLAERDDWLDTGIDLDFAAFPADARQRAAAAWARIGQMEHASVAAFARFTLQLLQCGAPAELVERATRATTDEVRHARLAFALATRCGGASVGPAALDVERSLEQTSLSEVVRLVVREGCVGETIAALQVSEAAAAVTSPRLRELLTRVAAEEAEHAELAWRFVRWALEREPALAQVLEEELARALLSPTALPSSDESLLGLGILSPSTEASCRSAALRDVVEPCLRALLASPLVKIASETAPSAELRPELLARGASETIGG